MDPQHRSLGQFFHDEVASRLGEDLYIRLPEAIPNSRLATLTPPSLIKMLWGFPPPLTLEVMNPRSNINRAMNVSPGTAIYQDEQRITHATSKCRPEMASALLAPSRTLITSSPLMDSL